MGHCNRVVNFEKCHVFKTLSPKIVFKKTQTTCSLIMKYGSSMSYFYVHFVRKLITFIYQMLNDF